MKKFLKILGYTLLAILLLSVLALVLARFLSPVIIEKAILKDLKTSGIVASVNIDIDRLSPFGIDIPEVLVDLGDNEIDIRNLHVDVKSLLTGNHELRAELGKLHLNLSDKLLSHIEGELGEVEAISALRSRNSEVGIESLFVIIDSNDIYLDVGDVSFSIDGLLFEVDGFKATSELSGHELIVTPFMILCNGNEFISFDEGLFSEDYRTFRLGQVSLHSFNGIPEGLLRNVDLALPGGDMVATMDSVELSGFGKYEDFLDSIITDTVTVTMKPDGHVLVDTVIYLNGEKKLLDGLGLDILADLDDGRFEIDDGEINHRKFKGSIPF